MPPNDNPDVSNTAEQHLTPAPVAESVNSEARLYPIILTSNGTVLQPTPTMTPISKSWWSKNKETKMTSPVSLLSYIPCQDIPSQPSTVKSPLSESLPILSPILSTSNINCVSAAAGGPTRKGSNGYCSMLNTDLTTVVTLGSPKELASITPSIANSTASLVPSDEPKNSPHGGPCDPCKDLADVKPESLLRMIFQVFIPYIIAGFGMVGAGLVLDKVQHWDLFKTLPAIYIVIPPLLGLKGNLEMTLASRLSTLANMGNIDTKKSLLPYVGGNMLISQCLASGIGFVTSLLAVFINAVELKEFRLQESFLLISSSVATAALSSFVLDSIMVAVILTSRRYGINPDNVATPIAASLGDITTIGLLAGIGSGLYIKMHHILWLGPTVSLTFLLLVPVWIILARRHEYTAKALKTTFMPVMGAMFISTGGGFILNIAVKRYSDLAVFQPIINGVGGNLVAIQASRIATSLHQQCSMGVLPPSHPHICINPFSVFFGRNLHARSARVLMLMVIPGQLLFIYVTSFISTGHDVLTSAFVGVYLFSAMLQVSILLYVATILTYLVWRFKIDPDNFSIPLLTALGDLLGIGLLFLAFIFLQSVGESYPNFKKRSLPRINIIGDT